MDLLTQLLVCVGAFALTIVVGTFAFMMLDTVLDAIDEQQQARGRDKTNRE